MSLIGATFSRESEAKSATLALHTAGFYETEIKEVRKESLPATGLNDAAEGVEVSPHHAVSAGAEESAPHAIAGAAVGIVAGVVAIPLAGPAAIAVGAGVGAYAGSLVGALTGLDVPTAEPIHDLPVLRADGAASKLMEVTVTAKSDQAQVVNILRAHGATTITDK